MPQHSPQWDHQGRHTDHYGVCLYGTDGGGWGGCMYEVRIDNNIIIAAGYSGPTDHANAVIL